MVTQLFTYSEFSSLLIKLGCTLTSPGELKDVTDAWALPQSII